jgi:hypothetical protein
MFKSVPEDGREPQAAILRVLYRCFVACIGMTIDTGCRVIPQDTLEAFGGLGVPSAQMTTPEC